MSWSQNSEIPVTPLPRSCLRDQRGKPSLLDDGKQSLRRAGGLLDAPLPVADQVLRDGEVAREDRLGEFLALPDPPDLAPGVVRQGRQACRIELAHGALVDRADVAQRLFRLVDGSEGIASVFPLSHRTSPLSGPWSSSGS